MKRSSFRTSRIMVNSCAQRSGAFAGRLGFALPTVLIASIAMLMILVTTVSVASSISSNLRNQRYTELATLAAHAGTVMAQACMDQSGGEATWSDAKPLKPNTDCSGNIISGQSAYVLEQSDVRTYFKVGQPLLGAGNVPVSAASRGYSEVLRKSSGVAWRVWSSDTSVVLAAGGADSLPVGSIIDGFWTDAPDGYLLTDGSAVSRTTYANLFAVIGTTYGSGNGSTTFNLPDTRGRVIVNKSSDTEFDTLGEKYGEKTHVLTVTEMPSHKHSLSNIKANISESNTGYASGGVFKGRIYVTGTGSGVGVGSKGSNGPHNNIQPSIVANQAIKY